MPRLLNAQLNQVCKYLSGQPFSPFTGFYPPTLQFDLKQKEFNLILYNTGLRYIELFEVNRWARIDIDYFQVVTAKNSNQRTFHRDELTKTFCTAIEYNAQYWWTCRFDSLSFYFNKHIGQYGIKTGQKYLNTHLFRHNKVKQMTLAGKTISEISEYLGEVSDDNTIRYRDSLIYKI